MNRPSVRATLGSLLLCSTLSSNAAVDDSYRFEVLLDDRPIGEHRFEIDRSGDQQQVASEAEFKVDFLFFTAYRYQHQSQEVFRNGCLQRIRARTNDNGTRYRIDGAARDDGFRIDRGEQVETAQGCIKTFAYWDPSILDQRRLLNPQTGELEPVVVRRQGTERIELDGRRIPASRYRLETGELSIDLWYHDELGWVRLASDTGKGATLIYRRI
ncbi:DUF6134 family protein [Halochromatium glycolicum]|uniref:Uncharacterized protein n=1 Tax=Halochromatium glycolicum TaxID=85075 RepID=A0AAJ0U727_9GAMM|nr:DUF6134 family protein [Halochromatium glycolicum]MBK1706514.1 hypothetical protein [Halochromatium glycolicum]